MFGIRFPTAPERSCGRGWTVRFSDFVPRGREAPEGTAIVADGFSCREGIEQGSGRPTRHIAGLLADRMLSEAAREVAR